MKSTNTMLLILLAVVALYTPCLGASIGIPTQAVVDKAEVTLADIHAAIKADVATTKKLQSVVLASAPKPGKSLSLNKENIVASLKENGFDLSKLKITCPDTIKISRSSVTVKGSEIAAAGEDLIRTENPVENTDELVITAIAVPQDVIAPRGNLELKVKASGSVAGRSRVALAVDVMVDGKNIQHCIVHYRVELMADVVVVCRNISRKTALSISDVKLEQKDLFTVRDTPVRCEDDLIGLRAGRSLTAGTIVTDALVEQIPLVQKGQEVVVIVRASGIEITTSGVALEDGAKNTMVRVRSSFGKEDYYAKVVAERSVEVNLSPVERASR